MVHSDSGWTRGVQVKLWDPLRTRAIPERLRGVFTTRRYTNPRLPLPLPFTNMFVAYYQACSKRFTPFTLHITDFDESLHQRQIDFGTWHNAVCFSELVTMMSLHPPQPVTEVSTPCFLVDVDIVRRNAQSMIDRCAGLGVKLRPHMKTHKCLWVFCC